jgi:hypothetical protein
LILAGASRLLPTTAFGGTSGDSLSRKEGNEIAAIAARHMERIDD